MKLRFVFLIGLMMATPWMAFANDAANEDALTLELRELAKDFAAIVEKKDGGSVAVGEFSPSSDIKASVGPRIQLVLAAELKKLKVTVDSENYRFEIKGDFQPLPDKDSGLLGVKIVARLIDRSTGEPLLEAKSIPGRQVFGSQTVPAMLGLNTRFEPNGDARDLHKELDRAKQDPRADIQGTFVRSQAGSPYAIQLLVKSGSGYAPRAVETDAKGRPLVPIQENEVYGVRLINHSAHEAAVDLQIDGINCFEFSEVKARFWIVGAGKQLDVLGWHKNDKSSLEFKVVDFPDTAANKLNLKPSATIGLITACFSASWDKDENCPGDEPRVQGRGTGFGAEIKDATIKVSRTIGQPRDTISVRYER